ncbi:HORMA domain protein [Trachipleistophora hominis]|uniref:HORMA domain protein n=1 Tax=Trachipleistophora hominis TaxID=72359 RepID=L7JS32_TRAHO|nr:HORMA domain protein [Trachipleistophora hominis]
MQEQETLQLQSLKSTLLHITTQRKMFPTTNPGPRNRFLCWLNNGIRDALSKNYLHQIILTIYTEKNRPDAILESYTITVTGKLCEKRPDKDIADVLKMLAPLPRTRYLSMRLVYNETCPDEYEPVGFKRADYEYVMNGNEVLVKDDIKIESRLEINKEKRDEIVDLNDTNGARNERVVVDDKIIKERGRGNEDMAERHGCCHPTNNGDSNEERKTEQKNSSATTTANVDVKARADSNTNICAINNSNVVEDKHQKGEYRCN